MKILFVLNDYKFFCSHFKHIAERLASGGDLITVASSGSSYFEDSLGIKYIDYSINRSSLAALGELKSILELKKIIDFVNPDIIHSFTIKPVLYSNLLVKYLFSNELRSISTITGMGTLFISESLKHKFFALLIKIAYSKIFKRKNTFLFFENDDDANYFIDNKLISKGQANIVNGAGVDLLEFNPAPKKIINDKVVITFVGRLLKDKGIIEFLDAAVISYKNNLPVTFIVVGDIDERNTSSITRHDINQYASYSNINFLGNRSDVNLIYSNSHVACLPSYREGLPKSLIEASASGLPIITTDVPGCRQIISNGSGGFLVQPKSSISIYESILRCLEDREGLDSMGRFNRRHAEKFYSESAIFQRYSDLYSSDT